MKNSLLTLSLICLCAGASQGVTLTPEEALSRVLGAGHPAMHKAAAEKPQLNFTQYEDGNAMVYMFSRGENGGFYAVSADDSSLPLLGYGDTGTLPASAAELPDGMRYWLETLAEQVAYNASNGLSYSAAPRSQKENLGFLLKTQWNQDTPYNNLCPAVGSNRCMTGCVATAMAQVLKHYNYPPKVQASHSYTWNNQTLSIDENVTFDWANMLDKYSGSETTAQNTAVATLMRACGVSVDMDYGTGSSGAVTSNALEAFINTFGYDQGARWYEHTYFTSTEWEDLIYNNLHDFGPVLFSGRNSSGGHAFVCDGYNYGLYHFNWGWGGMSDGYFVLTALDPGAQGIGGSTAGYNLNQGILCNVKIEHTSDSPYIWLGARDNQNFSVTVNDSGTSVRLSCQFSMENKSHVTIASGTVGISIIPGDGSDPTFVPAVSFSDLKPNYGWTSIGGTVTLHADLPDGTYTIVPAWRDANGNVDKILYPTNCVRSFILVKNSEGVTVSANQPASITATDFTLDSDLYKGSDFKNLATITNTSNTQEFRGILTVGLEKNGEKVAIGNNAMVTIAAGETKDWEYISSLRYFSVNGTAQVPAAGEYEMYLYQVDGDTYTPLAGPLTVTLHDAVNASLSINDLTIASGQNFWDMTATATVKCTSGYYAGTLTLYIFPSGGGYSLGAFDSEFFAIQAPGLSTNSMDLAPAVGETQVTWQIPFMSGAADTRYFAEVRYNNSWISNQAVFTTGKEIYTGIEEVETSAQDVVDTEYFTMTGISLGSERPQKGIYVVREKHADGSVTTRRVAF